MDRSYLVRTEAVDVDLPEVWLYGGLALLLVYIIRSLLLGLVFHKAGQAIWKAWVPLVNWWTFFKIGNYPGVISLSLPLAALLAILGWQTYGDSQLWFYAVSGLLVGVYLVYMVLSALYIQKRLNKPGVFIVLMFINLVAPLWLWILALDTSKWRDKKPRRTTKKP